MAVDEVEVEAVAQLDPGGQHVRVHVLHPGDELGEVGGSGRRRHAMHEHAAALLLLRRRALTAGEHVDVDALDHELLGELAHVPGKPALDDRRVLPGERQRPGAHTGRAIYWSRRSSSATGQSPKEIRSSGSRPRRSSSAPERTSRQRPAARSGSSSSIPSLVERMAVAARTEESRRNAQQRSPASTGVYPPANASGRRARSHSARSIRNSLIVCRVGSAPPRSSAERLAAPLPVDGAAVVGIHQRQRPQLVALVDVGHARGGQLQQGLAERRALALPRHPLREGLQLVHEAAVRVERAAPVAHAALVVAVGVDPVRVQLRLAQRLLDVGLESLGLERPGAPTSV